MESLLITNLPPAAGWMASSALQQCPNTWNMLQGVLGVVDVGSTVPEPMFSINVPLLMDAPQSVQRALHLRRLHMQDRGQSSTATWAAPANVHVLASCTIAASRPGVAAAVCIWATCIVAGSANATAAA